MGYFFLIAIVGLVPTVIGDKFNLVVDDAGHFNISVKNKLWFQSDDICVTSKYKTYCRDDDSLKKKDSSKYSGTDSYGNFEAVRINWEAGDVGFGTVVREYSDHATIIFQQIFPNKMTGTSVGNTDEVLSVWPSFKVDQYDGLNRGYLTWKGGMCGAGAHIGNWNSKTEDIGIGLRDSSPLAVFSTTNTVVISSASEFMSANQVKSGKILKYGIQGGVTEVPVDFSLETIFSLGSGVTNSMDMWGQKLLTRYGKNRDVANSDFTTNYLGYSTDNGAYYYYKTEDGKNYEETIIDVKAYADQEKIPYKHWLMDSWWYFKGDGGGVKNWTAMPSIFPNGIDTVFNATQWPIVAHNRFWSSDTDYAKQNGGKWDFIIEPNTTGRHKGMAFPLEQDFWDWLLSDARKWGLRTYEQDWLLNEFSEMNCTTSSATLARQWLMQMGTAASRNSLTVQYCMSWSRHMMQSVEIQAVTQARASGDYHPGSDQWQLGLSSIFAHAIAIKPTKDNFWSTAGEKGRYGNDTEKYNRLHAAVSTFSTGPVAPSDKIGGSDAALIMRSCTSGGKLLQPDRPAVRTDNSIYCAAEIGSGPSGEVWQSKVTLTQHTYHYLLATNSKSYSMSVSELTGSKGSYRAWEANNTKSPQVFDDTHPIMLPDTNKWTFNVWTIAPVLSNGWVLMGEADSKWVAVSNDRFSNLIVLENSLLVDIDGEPGEIINVLLLAPESTNALSVSCTIPPGSKTRLSMPAKVCKPF